MASRADSTGEFAYGLILISHAIDKTIETRTGEYTKTTPSLPDRARNVVLGLVDIILYGDSVSRKDQAGNIVVERVLRTKPHPTYEAGDRTVDCQNSASRLFRLQCGVYRHCC